MLVTLIGPGVLAGVIAIGLRSIGFCAKLLYEAIEEIDTNQVEAVIATGASRSQQLSFGIVPQIMPHLPASLYFAGISIFGNRQSLDWSVLEASACNWTLQFPP
jgi:phosphonate transport system permease protein